VRGSSVGIQVEIKMNVSDKQTVFQKKKKKVEKQKNWESQSFLAP
jgi:hypothetical protein